jgi:transposase
VEQGIKQTQRDYSLAFKLSVVATVEKRRSDVERGTAVLRLQGRPTVLGWLRKRGLQDWANPSGPARSGSTMLKPLTPEQCIKELETQLRKAQENSALFEAVLDVMRTDYGSP